MQGYIVKLERVKSEKSFSGPQQNNSSLESKPKEPKLPQPKFCFQYDAANAHFAGEFCTDQQFQMSAISSVKQDETFDFSSQTAGGVFRGARPGTSAGPGPAV